MAGCLDDPEATARAFRAGWFHSADLPVMHPKGYIELKDRAKDIIISGGTLDPGNGQVRRLRNRLTGGRA